MKKKNIIFRKALRRYKALGNATRMAEMVTHRLVKGGYIRKFKLSIIEIMV